MAGLTDIGNTYVYFNAPVTDFSGTEVRNVQFSKYGGVSRFYISDLFGLAVNDSFFQTNVANSTASFTPGTYSAYSEGDLGGTAPFLINVGPLAGAVPEPATWLMMICGFSFAGAALRRRKSAVGTAVRFA